MLYVVLWTGLEIIDPVLIYEFIFHAWIHNFLYIKKIIHKNYLTENNIGTLFCKSTIK